MNYADQFRKFDTEEHNRDIKEINTIWFHASDDGDGCFPTAYQGEDLLNDIINKFYEPLDFIRTLIEEKLKVRSTDLAITIMPSYEGSTFFTVTYKSKIVLLQSSAKAWNHFWTGDKDFNDWVQGMLSLWTELIKGEA